MIVNLTNPNSSLCWTLPVEWLPLLSASEEKRFLILSLPAASTPEAVFVLSL